MLYLERSMQTQLQTTLGHVNTVSCIPLLETQLIPNLSPHKCNKDSKLSSLRIEEGWELSAFPSFLCTIAASSSTDWSPARQSHAAHGANTTSLAL